MRVTSSPPGAARHSLSLIAGLAALAGTSYLTLILAGRMLGAASFAGISVLYVLVSSLATGIFLPVEQEIARRRAHPVSLKLLGGNVSLQRIMNHTLLGRRPG